MTGKFDALADEDQRVLSDACYLAGASLGDDIRRLARLSPRAPSAADLAIKLALARAQIHQAHNRLFGLTSSYGVFR